MERAEEEECRGVWSLCGGEVDERRSAGEAQRRSIRMCSHLSIWLQLNLAAGLGFLELSAITAKGESGVSGAPRSNADRSCETVPARAALIHAHCDCVRIGHTMDAMPGAMQFSRR